MEYIGPQDYFFWQGIEEAVMGTSSTPEEYLEGRLPSINKANIECRSAFKWGFYFGLEMTKEEYVNLTVSTSNIIIEDEFNKFNELIGNC